MSSSLSQNVERVKNELEKRYSVKLVVRPDSMSRYPELFELWTLFNVIKALTEDGAGELCSVNSYMNHNTATIVAGDVHPSGRVYGATVELAGMGLAPTLTVAGQKGGTSIWFDKYVGVSLDGCYWPRPDIVVRRGTYDVLKSTRFRTTAIGNTYEGGIDTRQGRVDSENIVKWRSLSELRQANPQLRDCSEELVDNFRITKKLISVLSTEKREIEAAVGQPFETLSTDDSNFVHGEIQGDDGIIFWIRSRSFIHPSIIIECKSGLLTPHAVEQLAFYRKLLPTSALIVATTRPPKENVLRRLCEWNMKVVTTPDSLKDDYVDVLRQEFREEMIK